MIYVPEREETRLLVETREGLSVCGLDIGAEVVIGRLGLKPGIGSEGGGGGLGLWYKILDPPVVFESTSSRLEVHRSMSFLTVETGLITWPAQCEVWGMAVVDRLQLCRSCILLSFPASCCIEESRALSSPTRQMLNGSSGREGRDYDAVSLGGPSAAACECAMQTWQGRDTLGCPCW